MDDSGSRSQPLVRARLTTLAREPADHELKLTTEYDRFINTIHPDPPTCVRKILSGRFPKSEAENKRRTTEGTLGFLGGICLEHCDECFREGCVGGEVYATAQEPRCARCSDPGHSIEMCPQRPERICPACRQSGHSIKQCKDQQRLDAYKAMTCKVCYSNDHAFKDCAEANKYVLSFFKLLDTPVYGKGK